MPKIQFKLQTVATKNQANFHTEAEPKTCSNKYNRVMYKINRNKDVIDGDRELYY